MMKISGRLRHRSTHRPATTDSGFQRERRESASARPKISESTMHSRAISMLIRKPSKMNRKLFPVISHSQLSGSKT
jgi:hypothetical protein